MGTPALALPALRALAAAHEVVAVATQPDRPSGRGRRLTASPVKAWAVEAGVPVLQPASLKDAAAVEAIAGHRPDVIVVLAYGLILPASVLRLPPLGCVNLHTSLLPRHRGASPIQAAILAGDADTGVTTMLMDEGLDTGPLLLQSRLPIAADDTAGSLGERLAQAAASLILETLAGLQTGALQAQPQRQQDATTTRLLRKQDGRIDWSESAPAIDRRVRAMQPWPGAWTGPSRAPWRILQVAPLAGGEGAGSAAPGEVVRADDRLLVACGGGAVEILRLQRPGGRPMSAARLLRGASLAPGDRFDEAADATS